jgi:hypothetical protein
MGKRAARRARVKARAEALVHAHEVDEAYEEARRAELIEVTVQGDEFLGSMVDALVESDRIANRASAGRVEHIYDISRYTHLNIQVTTSNGMRPWSQAATARRTAVSEVALALRIPERSAEALIEEARMLKDHLPLTFAALSRGDFSYRHAKTIVHHASSLPDHLHAPFEAAVVPFASKLTLSKFEQKGRTIRERMDAATIRERHLKSIADREVSFEPARDGMGYLHLYTSATVGLAVYNRADGMAHQLQGPDEGRTLTQLRADVMVDLLLDGVVGDRPEFGIRPSVVVTVPALAMLGHKTKNGELELPVLEGYGPIDVETATRLAGSGKTWLRVLTNPETGATLSVGRKRYKVPSELRAWLRLRDGTCRKPGCNRAAVLCDLDHTQEWQHGGQTAHDNLAHLCRQYHDEKHHTALTVNHLPNGDLKWTLPSGHTYTSEPVNRFLTIHGIGFDNLDDYPGYDAA